MRSHLSRSITGLLLLSGFAFTARANADPESPVDVYRVELSQNQVLPGDDLNVPGASDSIGTGREPAGPAPQAIPTPTAFHAGLAAMVAVVVLRRLRRRAV